MNDIGDIIFYMATLIICVCTLIAIYKQLDVPTINENRSFIVQHKVTKEKWFWEYIDGRWKVTKLPKDII